ncbi:hypothetical protein L6452_19619 [Arctium lappa]|uniref:Uncharacterized protein n=1 Tax=Arctium lappa TaxID=4217 RepID=A0ACB9B9L7_ARCLA|nr:hypothetical protein L6452_19619 [Arctium lappa]
MKPDIQKSEGVKGRCSFNECVCGGIIVSRNTNQELVTLERRHMLLVEPVKDAPPRTNDAIAKTAKCSKDDDSDFVASATCVRPSSSKVPKVDEQAPTHLTKKIVRDIKSMSLNDESTECEHMSVEHMRSTTPRWSFDLLRNRESLEFDAGGLGSANFEPLSRETPMAIDTFAKGLGSSTFDPLSRETPMEIDTFTAPRDERENETKENTDIVRLENIKLMDDKIALIMTMKWETEKLLESLLARYPNDECFANFIYILQDIYKYDIKYGSSGTGDFGGPSNHTNVSQGEETSRALVLSQDHENQLSQDHENQLSQFWFTLTLHKGVCLEDEGPLKKCKPLDESYHEFAANEPGKMAAISTRRSVRLGDHLRSPYVRRVVDMKVSAEDKRIHEWAYSTLTYYLNNIVSNDTVVLLDNGVKLIRRDLETLARNEEVSPIVVDLWAELLNYEEKYRNKDSIRRYFFTNVVMGDPKLYTPFTYFNTQYDMFNTGLERSMGDERSWKAGLTYEGPSQKTQVSDLRKKYTAKVAMTNMNKKRDETMTNVEKFNNI